jgi:ligand-binding sensor protein
VAFGTTYYYKNYKISNLLLSTSLKAPIIIKIFTEKVGRLLVGLRFTRKIKKKRKVRRLCAAGGLLVGLRFTRKIKKKRKVSRLCAARACL